MPARPPEDHGHWQRHADDLWSYHVDLRLAGVNAGRRMAAVRRDGGGWMLLSPVLLDDVARGELLEAGPVEALVVPTAFHNTFVAESAAAFPEAKLYLTAGAKRPDGVADERLLRLTDDLPEHWRRAAPPLTIEGMPRANEVVFLHPGSRSLLVADFCFNFDAGYGLGVRLLFGLAGAYPGVRQSRLYRALIRDREAYAASVERLLALDFDRVVPSHGRVVESGGREALVRLAGS